MVELAVRNEPRLARLYELVREYDEFVGVVLDRPHGLDTAHPQDYLASVLLVRSFRLMVGGLWLAASGYSDLSPNLGRTIWEIGIRLFYSQKEPVAAALPFFAYAADSDLASMEAELRHRRSRDEPVGKLPANCERVRAYRTWLESLAVAKGVDLPKALNLFGRLNLRQACREMGVEKAYLVDYAFASGHVHERNLTTVSFLAVSEGVGQYDLGPAEQADIDAVSADLLRDFSLVAEGAARLVGDVSAIGLAESIQRKLTRALQEMRGSV
jgi:hypothetical protein